MKREERNFNRKGDEETEEQPLRGAGEIRYMSGVDCILNSYKIECPNLGVEPKDGRQHEHRGDHGVQKEFHRRIDAPPMAVHSDQHRHWDQSGFPEEVKKE